MTHLGSDGLANRENDFKLNLPLSNRARPAGLKVFRYSVTYKANGLTNPPFWRMSDIKIMQESVVFWGHVPIPSGFRNISPTTPAPLFIERKKERNHARRTI
jgi:hypothetical protein